MCQSRCCPLEGMLWQQVETRCEMNFFASVCVIWSILNIPPVCIMATQLLIKFPATNSRRHNDICITMPPSLCHSEVVKPLPHLSSLFLSFQSFRIAY